MEKFADAKYILVAGIGGSDLAAKAVWNAITLHKEKEREIFFLESPDAREYEEIKNFINNEVVDLSEIVLIAISKSGETTETLTAFHQTFDILSEKFGSPINEKVLVISTPGSTLWQLAAEKNFEKLEWQGNVGGRFSAFTTPHLSVLSIAGLDAANFVAGGKEAAKEAELPSSLAQKLARDIFENHKKGADILDFFIFNSELEDLGKWSRQLIAESLATFTPTVSLGPTDLHSMLELYLAGPKNRFTLFIFSEKEIDESINESAYRNTTEAFEKAELPFQKYEMPEINERELGKFMAFMIEMTLYLAELLGENPYDQPAVEEYKHQITNSKFQTNTNE